VFVRHVLGPLNSLEIHGFRQFVNNAAAPPFITGSSRNPEKAGADKALNEPEFLPVYKERAYKMAGFLL
jgi:hypothetical protein